MGGVRAATRTRLQAQWLEDCSIRLLSVLALDRFTDWAAGDKGTAPVRETAAQALGVVLIQMELECARLVANCLIELACSGLWQVSERGRATIMSDRIVEWTGSDHVTAQGGGKPGELCGSVRGLPSI